MAGLPLNLQKNAEEADVLLRQIVESQKVDVNTEQAHETEKINESIPKTSNDAPEVKVPENAEESKDKKNEDFNSDTWKHKYDVLIGKYNAEVPRVASENKELRDKVESLQKSLEELQSKILDKEEQVEASQSKNKIRENLGDEVADAIEKLLGGGSNNKLPKQYEEKIKEIESKIDSNSNGQTKTNQRIFYDALTRAVPDWERVNVDPQWLRWLASRDEYSGRTYQELIDDAANSSDVHRVAKFFDNYKFLRAKPSNKAAIEEMVEPGKTKPTNPSSVNSKKNFTEKEIDEFYMDVRRGKYSNRQTERLAKEREFDIALAEGRIQ